MLVIEYRATRLADLSPTHSDAVVRRYRGLCDIDKLADALRAPHVPCIAVNTRRVTAARLIEAMRTEGVVLEEMPWTPNGLRVSSATASIGTLWPFHAGLYHVQEEASMVPVALLDVQPGQRVLDMCAAPGNKTAQIAAALSGTGLVIANDRSAGRLAAISNYVGHLGLSNVVVTRKDGRRLAGPARFDRVLVDAPCSGEGTMRRRPRHGAFSTATYRELLRTQRALLRRAADLTLPGGLVVYSTCTFAPEENEMVIADVLADSSASLVLRPSHVAGLPSSPGVTLWQGKGLPRQLQGCLRLWPHISNTGGFFVAVLEKLGDNSEPMAAPPSDSDSELVPAREHPKLAAAVRRFGISDAALGTLVAAVRGRYVRALRAGQSPPARAMTLGLAVAPKSARVPRFSTAGVLEFGASASNQVIDVDAQGARDYAAGRTLSCATANPGYYLVRHDGFPLGNAMSDGAGLTSLYPRAWLRGDR